MSISRFNAVEKASNRKAVEAVTPEHKVSEYYGENVFNRKAMQKYLSKETYKALTHAIDNGTPIDREIANHVAAGMRGHWKKESLITPTGFNRLPMAPPRSTTLSWNTMVTVA
jgi:glutamine synthetase